MEGYCIDVILLWISRNLRLMTLAGISWKIMFGIQVR